MFGLIFFEEGFLKIFRFLEWVLIEHIDVNNSLDSKLISTLNVSLELILESKIS